MITHSAHSVYMSSTHASCFKLFDIWLHHCAAGPDVSVQQVLLAYGQACYADAYT